ncbi:hypothetical protein HYT58_00520 [Candidatus Woesearchaeota archaeon]|nr:hypothetical protein [Candidatus Woesearchaeota archaeon]
MQQRQPAYKLWISDLVNGTYVKQEGEWDPNYVQVLDKRVSRVNLIGTVVSKFDNEDGSYSTITIDDSTSTIRLKAFRDDTVRLKNIKPSHMVLVIGKVREYNAELFIAPEVVKILDNPNWELARKLELIKICGKPGKIVSTHIASHETYTSKVTPKQLETSTELVVENVNVEEENTRQKIYSVISNTNGMISIKEVTEKTSLPAHEAEEVINELLAEGEIFEPKPGFLKSI